MRALNAIVLSGQEVLPLVEGGKGISISNGESSGAWAASFGVGTFSGVNADAKDASGNFVPWHYHGRTRRERHEELIAASIRGGITQAQIAYERASGMGRIHMNVLWEMAGSERVLHGILEGAKGLIHGVTCGAGMPYRIAEISERYRVSTIPSCPRRGRFAPCGSGLITSSGSGSAAWSTKIPGLPEATTGSATSRIRASRKTPIRASATFAR